MLWMVFEKKKKGTKRSDYYHHHHLKVDLHYSLVSNDVLVLVVAEMISLRFFCCEDLKRS